MMLKSNKEIIKEVYSNAIDKNKIYENIIAQNSKRKFKLYKIALFPICILIIIIISLNKELPNTEQMLSNVDFKENQNILNLNEIETPDTSEDIFGSAEDVTFNNILKEEPILENIKFPDGIKEERCVKLYNDLNSQNSSKEFVENKTFDGYDLMFGASEKSVSIFFSRTLSQRKRCMRLDLNEFENSTIAGKDVKILKYNSISKYIIIFSYNNIYWDIEANNITLEELVELVESIVREE